MNKKSVLPFAAVIAITAVWTIFTRTGSHEAMQLSMSPMRQGTMTKQTVSRDPADVERAERIREILKDFPGIIVHSLACQGLICRLEASARDSAVDIQPSLTQLHEKNPWLGSLIQEPKDEQTDIVIVSFQSEIP